MLLDQFKLARFIFQIRYPIAVEFWDNVGQVIRHLQRVWPGAEVLRDQATPAQVILKGDKVQIDTGLEQATVTLSRLTTLDQATSQQIVDTFNAWRTDLTLTKLNRASSRIIYSKEFPTQLAANQELWGMKLLRRPQGKVFDQPTDSSKNTIDLTYKFEDDASFAFVRVHTQSIKMELKADADFPSLKDMTETKNSLIIDFDRGLITPFDAAGFRADEWLKGFMHLLRRDLEKVLKE